MISNNCKNATYARIQNYNITILRYHTTDTNNIVYTDTNFFLLEKCENLDIHENVHHVVFSSYICTES